MEHLPNMQVFLVPIFSVIQAHRKAQTSSNDKTDMTSAMSVLTLRDLPGHDISHVCACMDRSTWYSSHPPELLWKSMKTWGDVRERLKGFQGKNTAWGGTMQQGQGHVLICQSQLKQALEWSKPTKSGPLTPEAVCKGRHA